MDHPFESPVILSFCPGILGLERGLTRAIGPVRIAAYVEIEAFIIANLIAGMEAGVLDPAPVWTDVKTFDAQPFRGKIHGIIGGYPCQPFSNAGKQLAEQDPRHLWPYLRRHIQTINPFWCFFENVAAHLKLGYRTVKSDLEELGYTVEEGIFTAEEVGAPHKRERLFILALADATEQRLQKSGWTKPGQSTKAANEVANAYGASAIRKLGNILPQSPPNEGKTQRGNWQWGWDEFKYGHQAMADTMRQRRQLQVEREQPTIKQFKWPAPQGSYQHEWEEPRTIEPGMGCTVNGYNFREDFLRALGNSVVEQTAELAFTTLLKKHFENYD